MCIAALALNRFDDAPVLLAGNRDEFYARPSAAAGFWPDAPDVFGGRDLEAGGSWLAVTRGGRLALVTNIRDFRLEQAAGRSRGELVRAFVTGTEAPAVFLARLAAEAHQYNPFNLIVGTYAPVGDLAFYALNSREVRVRRLADGVHAVSNGPIDAPWPKMRKMSDGLASLARDAGVARIRERCFSLLQDREIAADSALPDTGIGLARERALSAVYIDLPGYGTRASTVVVGKPGGEWEFDERSRVVAQVPRHP